MSRFIFAVLMACTGFIPAHADEATNISGRWVFTAQIGMGCNFGGQAFLRQVSEDRYEGELTATQSCIDLPEDYIVRQECEASRLGEQLSVRCTIAEFMNGFSSEFYYPDNFTLTIASSERMHGALVSGSTVPAVWQRNDGGIS